MNKLTALTFTGTLAVLAACGDGKTAHTRRLEGAKIDNVPVKVSTLLPASGKVRTIWAWDNNSDGIVDEAVEYTGSDRRASMFANLGVYEADEFLASEGGRHYVAADAPEDKQRFSSIKTEYMSGNLREGLSGAYRSIGR